MDDALVAGIDLSTQSCTLEVRRASDMTLIGRTRTPLPPTNPPVSEQDALVWWDALKECFHTLGQEVALDRIAAISVSGQCHGMVPLDEDGVPIRAVKLWNDTSTASHLESLLDRVGPEEWALRTGSVPTAAFTISKLAWYLVEEPDNAARTATILLPHDYVNYRLTGRFATDRSEASGTGYFNSITNEYDIELLTRCFGDALEWESIFPTVLPPDACLGTVSAEAANALGIPEGAPVTVGGGDQHIAALGLGLDRGDVVFSLGTSGVVIASSDEPVFDPTGRVNGVANALGGWLPLVCTLNATKVTDWAAKIMGVTVQELDALALAAQPEDATPVFAAYLDGERSPSYPESAAVLSGLTGATSRSSFAISIFEGVLAGLIRGMEAIEECGIALSGRVLAIGGGSRSPAYTTLLADLLGRPVEVIREPEATARGACLQAKALVDGSSIRDTASRLRPEPDRIVEPRSGGRSWSMVKDEYLRVCDFAGGLDRAAYSPYFAAKDSSSFSRDVPRVSGTMNR